MSQLQLVHKTGCQTFHITVGRYIGVQNPTIMTKIIFFRFVYKIGWENDRFRFKTLLRYPFLHEYGNIIIVIIIIIIIITIFIIIILIIIIIIIIVIVRRGLLSGGHTTHHARLRKRTS
jgi:hypothetical protein